MKIAVGIDIDGIDTTFGLIDRRGKCLAKGTVSTSDYTTPETFVWVVTKAVDQLVETLDAITEIKGLGIGAPAANSVSGTLRHAPDLPWPGVIPLQRLFERYFSEPVFVTSKANSAAMGEMMYGVANGQSDFLMVMLDAGLGSGVVSNGRLIHGHDGFAGMLGHMIIEEKGRLCRCGRRGCLEAYVSEAGLVRTAHELLAMPGSDSPLGLIPMRDLTPENIAEEADKGDPPALEILDLTAKRLALGLANAVVVTSPKMIVLGGRLARTGDLIVEPTQRYLGEYLLDVLEHKVDVVITAMNEDNAAILGAAAVVWQQPASKKKKARAYATR